MSSVVQSIAYRLRYPEAQERAASWVAMQQRCRPLYGEQSGVQALQSTLNSKIVLGKRITLSDLHCLTLRTCTSPTHVL